MKKLVIVGAGETALLAYEYFSYDSDYEVVAFSVSRQYLPEQRELKGFPIVAVEDLQDLFPPQKYSAFVALASGHLNRDRTKMYNELKSRGYNLASYISSRAFVWHNVEIGDNCFILEDNTLQPFVKIGNNVTLWSGGCICHRSIIRDNCFLSAQVAVAGFVTIYENCFLGINSSIADNVIVAKDNFIKMHTSIGKNTLSNSVYKGSPAILSKISAMEMCKVERES